MGDGQNKPQSCRDWLAVVARNDVVNFLPDTPWTGQLPRFQRDGAVRLLKILRTYRGAILADDVGLGKTHTASAVIRSRRRHWGPVLVVAPARVLPQWQACLAGLEDVTAISFARLSRGQIPSGMVFGLFVVDEAHRLRNQKTKRHQNLLRMASNARLLLITATPVHNDLKDVASLLALIFPRFSSDEKNAVDDLQCVLRLVTVRRTRWLIDTVYRENAGRIESRHLSFPSRRFVRLQSQLAAPLNGVVKRIEQLARSAFPRVEEAEMRTLFELLCLRRLESSPFALEQTLRRCRNYLERTQEAAFVGRKLSRKQFRRQFGNDPEGQVAQLLLPFFFDALGEGATCDLSEAIQELNAVVSVLSKLSATVDAKLRALVDDLTKRHTTSTLIMTCYEDTARYLFRNLPFQNMAMISSNRCLIAGIGPVSKTEVMRRFAPIGQRSSSLYKPLELLISTDVLAEGVNLQDANLLVHYDRPWNPMTLEQRLGRLDRIGSPHRDIEIVVFDIPAIVERRLGLERTLNEKTQRRQTLFNDVAEGERIGIDQDGFLMACCSSRLATSSRKPVALSDISDDRGWLVAVEASGHVAFVAINEDGVKDGQSLLPHLFDTSSGPRVTSTVESPPVHLLVQACHFVSTQQQREQLRHLEPYATLRDSALERQRSQAMVAGLQAAYRLGSVGSIQVPREQDDDVNDAHVSRQPPRVIGWLQLV